MAHTKSAGSTKLGRDSISKRLGVKVNHGQSVNAGGVIVRQRGTKYIPGPNVRRGCDDTLYAVVSGVVKFYQKNKTRFDGSKRRATFVSVIPTSK